MRTAYTDDAGTGAFIRKVFALPMLPVGEIRQAFDVLQGEAAGDQLQALCRYISETWMTDGLWSPDTWCVYKRTIRTNNDVEGKYLKLRTNFIGLVVYNMVI